MKPFGSSRLFVSGGWVLLSVLLFAIRAAGQLAVQPPNVRFSSLPIGSSASQSLVLTNTGNSNLTISQARASGTGFSVSGLSTPLILGPSGRAWITATFTAQASGSASGSVRITYSVSRSRRKSYSSSTATVSLAGTGTAPGRLAANPATLNFASVQVGNSLNLTDSFTNTGEASVSILSATVSGSGFGMQGLEVPLVLNPGASVTFSTVFTPQSAGSFSGSITIASNGSNPTLTVALAGTGTARGQLTITPTALDFGGVTVGTSASQSSQASASGASVTVSSASLSSAEFSLAGISFPVTLAAGQSVPFTLTFAPQTTGAAQATLALNSNAANLTAETLSGIGTALAEHSVALSWTGSSTEGVTYSVYRRSSTGGSYSKITSAMSGTTYVDNEVLAGETYWYAATAVDSRGAESVYSNEVRVVIPSP